MLVSGEKPSLTSSAYRTHSGCGPDPLDVFRGSAESIGLSRSLRSVMTKNIVAAGLFT